MKYVFFPSVDPDTRALVDNLCTVITSYSIHYTKLYETPVLLTQVPVPGATSWNVNQPR